jgi:hypothetical protein
VNRQTVIRALRDHGHQPDSPTVWHGDLGLAWTSFDAEIGIRDHYTVREVREWLGY